MSATFSRAFFWTSVTLPALPQSSTADPFTTFDVDLTPLPTQLPVEDYSVRNAHGGQDGSDPEILCLAFVAADVPLLTSAGNDRAVRCWCCREHSLVLVSVLQVLAVIQSMNPWLVVGGS